MNTGLMIRKAADLSSDQLMAVEALLGRRIRAVETVSVQAFEVPGKEIFNEGRMIDTTTKHPLLSLGTEFFQERSIQELALQQSVSPQLSVSDLSGGFPVDEDIEEFLSDIYSARYPSDVDAARR